jgi:hypothetical protein
MMLGSKLAVSGTWPLIRVETSIRQEPALEIQILPVEEAWDNSCADGASGQEGGRATVHELESVRDKFGVFSATLMLPRPTDTASIAIPSKSEGWHPIKIYPGRIAGHRLALAAASASDHEQHGQLTNSETQWRKDRGWSENFHQY